MKRTTTRLVFDSIALGIAMLATALLAFDALAGGSTKPQSANAAWQSECGSCHVAYPPHLLPARSWHALMSGLDRHFGTNASIDPATTASILAFLEANAGRDRSPAGEPALRITETGWFLREHDEIRPAVWRNPKVGSAANCGACHQGAESGRFSEHDVRIPR